MELLFKCQECGYTQYGTFFVFEKELRTCTICGCEEISVVNLKDVKPDTIVFLPFVASLESGETNYVIMITSNTKYIVLFEIPKDSYISLDEINLDHKCFGFIILEAVSRHSIQVVEENTMRSRLTYHIMDVYKSIKVDKEKQDRISKKLMNSKTIRSLLNLIDSR